MTPELVTFSLSSFSLSVSLCLSVSLSKNGESIDCPCDDVREVAIVTLGTKVELWNYLYSPQCMEQIPNPCPSSYANQFESFLESHSSCVIKTILCVHWNCRKCMCQNFVTAWCYSNMGSSPPITLFPCVFAFLCVMSIRECNFFGAVACTTNKR